MNDEKIYSWHPTFEIKRDANITQFMSALQIQDLKSFHKWTIDNWEIFWEKIISQLKIKFKQPPSQICDLTQGVENPDWLKDAKLNIADSCFTADPSAIAIFYQNQKITYAELNKLSNQVANSLIAQGFVAGDAMAIAMPMNSDAVAIYIGIIKMGGIVVSIADSFSSQEMAVRMTIAHTKAVFTQDFIAWGGKKIPLYEKVKGATHCQIIVLQQDPAFSLSLRDGDIVWKTFLLHQTEFNSVPRDPMQACNILFSSGTTAEPKAIPWNHTTPIKCASDAYFHQNIKPGDVLAWPTNLGWMMGPWLIFAALINHATIALYTEAPKDRAFGEFVQNAKVTMLGVVPTLVATWHQSHCMEGLDWSHIKVFSSSGECSNAVDMQYLMNLAGNKPVIEYCGGTEIGGAYVSSTVIEENIPSLFSIPTMGLTFTILDESGHVAETGEVAIIPPSIGLSTELLNANHHHVYYENMPKNMDGKILRRHGDQIKKLDNGYYVILGRVDDTMNLGGIKISSAEIERVLADFPNILESAAIAITPYTQGPSQLIIFAATTHLDLDKIKLKADMQHIINKNLNPLFKIQDVVLVPELPKTASNKIMRRILRNQYMKK